MDAALVIFSFAGYWHHHWERLRYVIWPTMPYMKEIQIHQKD
jgi:hypothetical protein